MKNTAILSLVCVSILCVIVAFLGRRGEVGRTRAAPRPAEPAPAHVEEGLVAPAEPEEREVLEASAAEESEQHDATASGREEKEPGHLRGHIVDGNGNRIPVGRVLVFRGKGDGEPLAAADVEGAEREYRFTLPSEEGYYVAVDPASVAGYGVPPLSRGLARVERDSDGSIPSSEYTRWWVRIPEADTVRQDLPIARLGEVTGRLIDEQGQPIPGIVSRIEGLEAVNSGHSQDDVTDERGVFRHPDVFPGSHRLKFFSPEAEASAFQPPLPIDVLLASGESHDVGDVRSQDGTCAVVGSIVDQDGRPFAGLTIAYYPGPSSEDQKNAPGLGEVMRRTKTGADGAFELSGLPAGPAKISLTLDYEPGKIVDGPAFWEPPVETYLSRSQPVTDIGVHVVQQSRPFRLEGNLLERVPRSHEGRLRASVSQVGPPLPDVRRASLERRPVKLDWETGTFECLIETPRPEIEVRFELQGHEDLVFLVQPEPWGVWTHDIRLPSDFTPLE